MQLLHLLFLLFSILEDLLKQSHRINLKHPGEVKKLVQKWRMQPLLSTYPSRPADLCTSRSLGFVELVLHSQFLQRTPKGYCIEPLEF